MPARQGGSASAVRSGQDGARHGPVQRHLTLAHAGRLRPGGHAPFRVTISACAFHFRCCAAANDSAAHDYRSSTRRRLAVEHQWAFASRADRRRCGTGLPRFGERRGLRIALVDTEISGCRSPSGSSATSPHPTEARSSVSRSTASALIRFSPASRSAASVAALALASRFAPRPSSGSPLASQYSVS